jgi:hypothetical protein
MTSHIDYIIITGHHIDIAMLINEPSIHCIIEALKSVSLYGMN